MQVYTSTSHFCPILEHLLIPWQNTTYCMYTKMLIGGKIQWLADLGSVPLQK